MDRGEAGEGPLREMSEGSKGILQEQQQQQQSAGFVSFSFTKVSCVESSLQYGLFDIETLLYSLNICAVWVHCDLLVWTVVEQQSARSCTAVSARSAT